MNRPIVTVAGATGTLGLEIVKALLAKGAAVRALVRATSNRSKLEALGVTDFVVGDLMDPASLKQALAHEPKAQALVASAAGYTGHTKGDSAKTDTEGYRNLVDAASATGLARFVLISILESDKATSVPHFHHKYQVERSLAEKKVPYMALRPGAFLDQAQDMALEQLKKGVYPEFVPGVAMGMIYTPDLARYAAMAALDVAESELNSSVDVGWSTPADGARLAAVFQEALGRPIVAKPAFPAFAANVVMPFLGLFVEPVRDLVAMVKWIRTGAYVSADTKRQQKLFGEVPTIQEAVGRYVKDKGLT